jgi:N6-L-threonylcarbamoyladenine synthase
MNEATSVGGLELKLASPALSTDNAAMIAYAASERYLLGYRSDFREDADPNLRLI